MPSAPSKLYLALDKALHEVHAIQGILSQAKHQPHQDAGYSVIREALRLAAACTVACQTEDAPAATIESAASQLPQHATPLQQHHDGAAPRQGSGRFFLTARQSLDSDDLVRLSASCRATASVDRDQGVDQALDGTGRLSLFSNFSNDLYLNDLGPPGDSNAAAEPAVLEWGSFLSAATPSALQPSSSLKASATVNSAHTAGSRAFSLDRPLCPLRESQEDSGADAEPLRMPLRSLTDALNSCMPGPVLSASPVKAKNGGQQQQLRTESPQRLQRVSSMKHQALRSSFDLPSSKDKQAAAGHGIGSSRLSFGNWRSSFEAAAPPAAKKAAPMSKENCATKGAAAARPLARQSMPAPLTTHSTRLPTLMSVDKPMSSLAANLRGAISKAAKGTAAAANAKPTKGTQKRSTPEAAAERSPYAFQGMLRAQTDTLSAFGGPATELLGMGATGQHWA